MLNDCCHFALVGCTSKICLFQLIAMPADCSIVRLADRLNVLVTFTEFVFASFDVGESVAHRVKLKREWGSILYIH